MAHNARIRLSGFWTLGSTFDPAEAEAVDQAQSEAINGDQGGTWAPAAVIAIGGAGLTVAGELRATDAIDVTFQSGGSATWEAGATATFDGAGADCLFDNGAELAVSDDAEFTLNRSGDYLLRAFNEAATGQKLHLYGDFLARSGSEVTCKSGSTVDFESGCALGVDCVTTMGANSNFGYQSGHVSTFQGGSSCTFQNGSDMVAQNGARVNFNAGSTFTNASTQTRTGPLTISGDGATTKLRMKTLSAVANDTIDISADVWTIPASLALSLVYTVDNAGASAGMVVYVRCSASTGVGGGQASIQSDLGPVLFSKDLNKHLFLTLIHDGSDWQVLNGTVYDETTWTGTGLYGN